MIRVVGVVTVVWEARLVRVNNRVFQKFWRHGNQSFLRTTLPPDNRETLRFVIELSFLLWPGL